MFNQFVFIKRKIAGFLAVLGLLFLLPISAFALDRTASRQDNSANEDGFRVYDATVGTLLVEVPANVITVPLTGLSPGQCLVVKAFNIVGESPPSNTACVGTIPNAPNGFTISITITLTPQ